MAKPEGASPVEASTGVGCLARFFWFVGGNVILVVSAKYILQHHDSFLSLWDAVFWVTTFSLIAVRYLDVTRLNGQTAAGGPANIGHWRRYALLLLAGAIVAWLAAHGWAHFNK